MTCRVQGGERVTYYEAYSACKTEDEIKEMAIKDTRVAIIFGNNHDRIKAIEDAMNRAIAEKNGEEYEQGH